MATVTRQPFEHLPIDPLALISLLTLVIIIIKWLYFTTKNPLPSPRKLPIIGNLHQLGKLPHRSLRSLSRRHGDVMLLHLGSKPTLVVSSRDAAEEIMKTQDTAFANRPLSKVASILFYNGTDMVFAKYGQHWKKTKSICLLNMLNNKKVQSFRRVREQEVALMIESFKTLTPYTPVDLSTSSTKLVNNVMCRAVFGRKYEGEEGCSDIIKELLEDFMETLGGFSFGVYVPWLSWVDKLIGVLSKAKRVAKTFDLLIENSVQEHINAYHQREEEVHKGESNPDLVDVLLEIQRNDPSLQMVTIKGLLLDMLIGGIASLAALLEWTMSELLLHPRVMKELQEEVRRFLKGKTMIDEDDLKDMKYLKLVIKEAIRLHPPAPLLLARESITDAKVQNCNTVAGTQIIINAWAIQRHPIYWEDPEEFKPERFLNLKLDMNGQDFEFIPFGAGRRGCPGMSFAIVIAELALANLVGVFNWNLPGLVDADSFMAEKFGTAVLRRDPLLVIPTQVANYD